MASEPPHQASGNFGHGPPRPPHPGGGADTSRGKVPKGAEMVPISPVVAGGAYLIEAPAQQGLAQQVGGAPVNPLLLAHRALRGRYVVAVILALIVGAAGSVGGWMATKPKYESQGWIRAFPRQQRILYETQENQALHMFDAYVRAQAELARSRRVVDLALNQPEMRRSGWPLPPDGVRELTKALNVSSGRGSELISVTVSHEDPQLAQVAANAVLAAFMQYQEEQDNLTVTDRERRLRENQSLLAGELKVVRDAMIRMSDQFGGDLEVLISARTDQLTKLDAVLTDPVMMAAAAASPTSQDQPRQNSETPAATVSPEDLPIETLAKFDEMLATLISRRSSLLIDLESSLKVLGANHRDIRAMRQRLAGLETAIDTRAGEVREKLAAMPAAITTAPSLGGSASAQDPAIMYRQAKAQRDRIAAELRDMLRARMELKSLRERERDIETRLAETNRALEAIRVEDEIIRSGRVRIQQLAATPLTPTKDRRAPLAVAGFLGGAGAVVGLFVLASLVQRRVRYADELESIGGGAGRDAMLPLIGVIPEARGTDPETAGNVALALHHIRNTLLLFRGSQWVGGGGAGGGGTVYLITSAVQGEGKTASAIALGASFSQAGYDTVVVDCDFVGHGMTRELAMTGVPGLAEALQRGADGSRPDVVEETPIEDCLHDSHVPGLRVMPAGRHDDAQAQRLKVEQMAAIIRDLRARCEIAIIDTGPILGSLEAGVIAQLADVVVVIASRGTSSRLVSAAIDRARSLRASLRGDPNNGVTLVFNRADRDDLTTSASYSSFRSVRSEGGGRSAERAARVRRRSDRGRLLRTIAGDRFNEEPANGASVSGNGRHVERP